MEFLLIKLLSTIPLRSYLFYVPAKLPPEVEVLGWPCNVQCELYIQYMYTVQYTVQCTAQQTYKICWFNEDVPCDGLLVDMWWLIGRVGNSIFWSFDLRSFRRSAVIESIFLSQKTIDSIERKKNIFRIILTVFPTFYAKRLNRFRRSSIFSRWNWSFNLSITKKRSIRSKNRWSIRNLLISDQVVVERWWLNGWGVVAHGWTCGDSMVEVLWLMGGHVVAPWLRCCGSWVDMW